MKKNIFLILTLTVMLFLCACGKQDEPDLTSDTISQTASEAFSENGETATEPLKTTAPAETSAPQETHAVTAAPDIRTDGSKSIFTTNPENKFIKTVAEQYGVDARFLAALYTESDNNNYVWQFDGTTDENGKPVRTPETLKYVYALDKNCSNIQYTDGESEFVNCSSPNGILVFEAAKQLLIPKFQEYL